jgi:hypothetical protein
VEKASFTAVVKRYWVTIVAACVVVHGTASIAHGFSRSPHHHTSVWLVIAVILSFAGGWWVAIDPVRLQPKSRGWAWAFGVAVVVFLAFDALDQQGGVLIRNGVTALAWIAGVGCELGRQALVRRRSAAVPAAS